MIKINLLAGTEKVKARAPKAPRFEGVGTLGQNVLMAGLVILALLFIGWRWYSLESEARKLRVEITKAQAEKERLQAIIKKGEEYKAKKELLERKIALITQLKRNQSGPVHLLDEVSKQLPDFLWLDSMNESGASVVIRPHPRGKDIVKTGPGASEEE